MIDFSGDIIRLHEKLGFRYIARYCVWKEPLGVRNRTMAKGLAHKQICDDSTLCDVASADYVLLFRKPGENQVPVRDAAWGAPALCMVFLLRFFSEGTGNTTPTMFYGVAGALLNIPLNYVMMFGKLGFPALGTVGCGYAPSIVIWLQFLLLVLYIGTHRHYRPFSLMSRLDMPDWKTIWSLLKVGIPIAAGLMRITPALIRISNITTAMIMNISVPL